MGSAAHAGDTAEGKRALTLFPQRRSRLLFSHVRPRGMIDTFAGVLGSLRNGIALVLLDGRVRSREWMRRLQIAQQRRG